MKEPAAAWIKPPGPVAPGLKIGLLGGSFNPAHAGHLHVSEVAMKRLGLDYVWWLVSPQNPLKPQHGMAPFAQRFASAEEAARNHARILVLDIEKALGTRYTIDTLAKLKRRFAQVHFVWLMGSDNLDQFRRWKRWRDILQTVPLAVVTRPGSVMAMLRARQALPFGHGPVGNGRGLAMAVPPAIAVLDGRRHPASSTALRAEAAKSEIFVYVLPA